MIFWNVWDVPGGPNTVAGVFLLGTLDSGLSRPTMYVVGTDSKTVTVRIQN